MTYSEKGLALTKESEGLRLKAYRDSVGVLTIGYGHTKGVTSDMICDEMQASEWLLADLQDAIHAVETLVTVSLNQGQFDALVDFIFNLGASKFKASTLLKKLNAGDYDGASAQFGNWIFAGGKVLPGLIKRRAAERDLFDGET